MKKEHHRLFPPVPEISAASGGFLGRGGSISSYSSNENGDAPMAAEMGKAKIWEERTENDAGVDEHLAVLGYNVRPSDMAEVAQQLEHLDEVMGNAQVQDDLLGLVSDTVHYNPSDLCSSIQHMLTEFCALQYFAPPPHLNPLPAADDPSSTLSSVAAASQHDSSSDYDLSAIPGRAVLSNTRMEKESSESSSSSRKRLKSRQTSPPSWEQVTAAPPVVLLDSQENGIRLVHTLQACAEALQQENRDLAEMLVKQIGILAASQAGAMGKVAGYFAEGLAIRVYRLLPPYAPIQLSSLCDKFQMHFYETCPYLKFAHLTANQAILQAFAGKNSVHVVDLAVNHGLQWPALMQDLAIRPGGPPASFRLTGIGRPSPDGANRLRDVGRKLSFFAERINVPFEYRSIVAGSLTELDPSKMGLVPGEAVAVNSVFELHRSLASPGGIERVLSAVRAMGPEVVTVVEQEASHNGPVFLDRFMEALGYYSTMFDSLEGAAGSGAEDRLMSEMYLGRQICNVVACEGADRVERHEPVALWRRRLEAAGFVPAHLGSNAFKQASMLLGHLTGGDGFRVEENGGCLLLGWYTRALVATSAWRVPPQPAR